jgi:CRP-like cAMP-binding protein
MMLKDEFNVLRSIPLFAGMEPSKLKLLAFASDRVNFDTGETIFRQDDVADACYVILAGEVEASVKTRDGVVNLGTIGPEQVVGEVAILTESPRLATVKARTPVETLRITKDHFHKLLACCPGTMAEIIRVLGERMARVG